MTDKSRDPASKRQMDMLFQPWETPRRGAVVDYYQNHFLKSVFRALGNKRLAKVNDDFQIIEKQEEAITAQLGVCDLVTERGLRDNPDVQDQVIIVDAAIKALNTCIDHVDRRWGRVDPMPVHRIRTKAEALKARLPQLNA